MNPAAIVLVSADFAGRWNFDQKGLLRRVVVDECHLTYTASHYRARLVQLKNLRFLSCPIVLLTATQSPMLEHELAEAMLVRGAQYIRASTAWPNIRYLVRTAPTRKMLRIAVQIYQRQMSCLNSSRGVVYCKSRAQCEEVAQHLGCGFYHAGMDAEGRRNGVERWMCDGGSIVATSALGTGVDYPDIEYILHVEGRETPDIVTYLPLYGYLVCTLCGSGIVRKVLLNHLQRHHNVSSRLSTALLRRYRHLPVAQGDSMLGPEPRLGRARWDRHDFRRR